MRTSLSKFKEEVRKYFYQNHATEFSTPKYHILEHYVEFIEQFGSLLNGDTDTTEGLHPTVKSAYCNTNKKGTTRALTICCALMDIGNYVAQMARNLDEGTIIKMFHNMKIPPEDPIQRQHLELWGVATGAIRTRIDPHRRLLTQYLLERFAADLEMNVLEQSKFTVYNGIHCIYRNTNDPEKDLRLIARAVPVWRYGVDKSGSRYDFVLLKTRPGEEGLAGIDIARLYILMEIQLPNEVVIPLAVVRMCERVLDNTLLPSYKYTNEELVIPVALIVRNIHMVPRWDRPLQPQRRSITLWNDIYDEYEQFLFNTHTDCAAWTYYYDD